MKSKKIIVSLTLISVLMANSFIGCSTNKKQEKPIENDSQATAAANQPEPLTLPITKDKITLKVFTINQYPNQIQSYAEIEGLNEIQRRTGINIQWEHPASNSGSDVNAKLNLYFASGQMPDVIANGLGGIQGGYANLIANNQIMKLNDLVKNYMPNYSKKLNADSTLLRQTKLDDGTMAAIYDFDTDLRRRANGGFGIRQDWLKKLNLKSPATMDELHDVLVAFRDKDPNGNGKKDEIPYIEEKGTTPLSAFVPAWGILDGVYVDEQGKLQYGPIQPAYKEFIKTMNAWYKEGLIDPEFPTQDGKSVDAKQAADRVGLCVAWVSSTMNKWNNAMRPKNPDFTLYPMQWPVASGTKLRNGKPYTSASVIPNVTPRISFTSSLKYPKEAAKFFDYFFTDDGDALVNWGIEGKSYTVVNGKKQFTDAILKDPQGPVFAISKFATPTYGGLPKTWAYENGMPISAEGKAAAEMWVNCDVSLQGPQGVSYTAEEGQTRSSITTEIDTYKLETVLGMILGTQPIDKFDEFVSRIKKMNIEQVLKIDQTAIDRLKARK